MGNILIACELGGALGHVSVLGRLARELETPVTAVVPDIEAARPWFPADTGLLPSPPRSRPTTKRLHRSFPDLFEDQGWATQASLSERVAAWRVILDRVAPSVLVADSAPTLTLAAYGSGIPVIGTGTPFLAPPHRAPWPGLRVWSPPDDAPLRTREKRLVGRANLCRASGSDPLVDLRDLYRGVQWRLQGAPALDPWLEWRRPEDRSVGPLPVTDRGVPVPFPPGEGPRIFAYLKPDYPMIDKVLSRLAERGRLLAFVPGQALAAPGLRIVEHPVHLAPLIGSTDLLVTHSVLGTGSAFLGRGIPALFLPMQLEQLAIGRCAAELSGVVTVPQQAVARKLPEALARALDRRTRAGALASAAQVGGDGMAELVRSVRDAGG